MSKQKTRIFYYNVNWERQSWAQGWLMKADFKNQQDNQAYCKACRRTLQAQLAALKKHATNSNHEKAMNDIDSSKQKTLDTVCNVSYKKQEKARDLSIATFIACHTSIRSMDHLSDVLKKSTPALKDMKMHRTKCSNLITNVIAPNFLKELIEDIGDMEFSLMPDESNDVTDCKYLILMIKYFSRSKCREIADYLGLLQIERADANSLYEAMKDFCKEIGLNTSKCIALGTDGGSNLCGKNQSLYTLMKNDIPHLELVRCVCHVLNNAASAAAEEFPAHIDFLLEHTYSWFSKSTLRKAEYKITWETMNAVDPNNKNDFQKEFYKFVQPSKTRWLAKYNSVKVISDNFLELKVHFALVVNNEKNYSTRQLHQMYQDDGNYLYLVLIKPILYEINETNLAFQKTNVDPAEAYELLESLILFVARKIMKNSFLTNIDSIIRNIDNNLAFLAVNEVDYGIEYSLVLLSKDVKVTPSTKSDIQKRFHQYLVKLLKELCARLPLNLNNYKKLKNVSPSICLNQVQRAPFKNLPFIKEFITDSELLLKVENQYNKLLNINWTKIFEEKILNSSYEFWAALYAYKNVADQYVFRDLALFMLKILILPSSNAVVERGFSIMNLIKTKIRNRMLLVLLDSLMRIRLHLLANNMCCHNFEPSDSIIKDFNAKVVYNYDYLKDLDLSENEGSVNQILNSLENTLCCGT